jgi:hypothetical protein
MFWIINPVENSIVVTYRLYIEVSILLSSIYWIGFRNEKAPGLGQGLFASVGLLHYNQSVGRTMPLESCFERPGVIKAMANRLGL